MQIGVVPALLSALLFGASTPLAKLLLGTVRGAYQDFLAPNRHPVVALFLDLPADAVDVNVHPAKAEVRFREPGMVRGTIVSALKNTLAAAGHRASTTVSLAALVMGMLNARFVFGVPASASTVFNIVSVIAGMYKSYWRG